jgi:hypothetical protein
MTHVQAMKAQLAAIKPVVARNKATKNEVTESSWLDGTAAVIGSIPSHTISGVVKATAGTRSFLDIVKTSYQFNEAVRKGEIKVK